MLAIYKREFKSYFQSMIGYLFIAFLALFVGLYFMAYNLNGGYPYFAYSLYGVQFIFLVAVPILTMKCFAEERKSKTDQLLLTAPVRLIDIVLGKYLAMVSVFAIPMLVFCFYPLVIKMNGTAYLKVDYISIFAFFLLGCVYIAIGMFISALTESQIIAAVGTFAILLILYMWDGILSFLPTGTVGTFLSETLGKIELSHIFSDIFMNNLLSVSGLIYYVSLIVLLLFLTVQSIQKRRWS
ncbi:MAG: ABC transporter permease [Faecalimonas sp.]|nr:ABC transporter permease [Faecalimonas sp.]